MTPFIGFIVLTVVWRAWENDSNSSLWKVWTGTTWSSADEFDERKVLLSAEDEERGDYMGQLL